MSDENAPLDVVVPTDTLQEYIGTFLPVVDEMRVHFREDEIYAEAQDPANVALINEWLDESACEAYWATGVTVGLNLERLDDYLNKADGDIAHLELNPETRRINVECGRSDYTMATIDPDAIRSSAKRDGMGSMDGMVNDVTVDGGAFTHAVDLAGMVADHITVECDPDADEPVRVTGQGDTDDMGVGFDNSLHEGSHIAEATESIYSEDYLSDITSPIPADAALRIRTADEWPIALDYEWNDGQAEVAMLLTPRIQKS